MATLVVICLERGADLHMAQLMPLPLTVSCFSKIQFTFTVSAHLGRQTKAVKRACVRVLFISGKAVYLLLCLFVSRIVLQVRLFSLGLVFCVYSY